MNEETDAEVAKIVRIRRKNCEQRRKNYSFQRQEIDPSKKRFQSVTEQKILIKEQYNTIN